MAAEDAMEGLLDSADNFSIRQNKRRMKILEIFIRRVQKAGCLFATSSATAGGV